MKVETQLSGGTFCGSKVVTRPIHFGEIVIVPCNKIAKQVGNYHLDNIIEVYVKGEKLLHHIGGYNKKDETLAITKKDPPQTLTDHEETPDVEENKTPFII